MGKILVTRALEDYLHTAKKLETLGFEAIHSPVLKFVPSSFEQVDFLAFSALVFTSANGVRALKTSPDFEKFKKTPCYAVGEHSAQLAIDYGFKLWGQGKNDVVSLAKLIKKDYKDRELNKPLLHISGVDNAGNLSETLFKVEIIVKRIQAYKMIEESSITSEIKQSFITKQIDAILLYSARSANIFVKNMKDWGFLQKISHIPIYCLSKNIATSVDSDYLKHVYFVSQPDEMQLLELMKKDLK